MRPWKSILILCLLLVAMVSHVAIADWSIAPSRGVTAGGKYDVGEYAALRGRVAEPGLDAHHVGQQALMKRYVPGYDPQTAPSILVPKVGHTLRGPQGIVSRSTSGISSARQAVARDIFELRRVYPDVPNSQLKTAGWH